MSLDGAAERLIYGMHCPDDKKNKSESCRLLSALKPSILTLGLADQLRRLYDIANILISLDLVERVRPCSSPGTLVVTSPVLSFARIPRLPRAKRVSFGRGRHQKSYQNSTVHFCCACIHGRSTNTPWLTQRSALSAQTSACGGIRNKPCLKWSIPPPKR